MVDCKCSFGITLITEDFSCENAQLVTRRAGPDIACRSKQGSQNCKEVYKKLKSVGLPAFGAVDDLLKTPASVYTKIQFGGLLGIQRKITNDDSQIEKVGNIFQLVNEVLHKFQAEKEPMYQDIVSDMTGFKIKRKKKTKRK